MKTNWLDYTLLTFVIIGAINWGLSDSSALTLLHFCLEIFPGFPALSMRW